MNPSFSLRAELENHLRRDWSWPSPESGFARWIFTSTNQRESWISSWARESLVQELETQSHWNYSPLLAACGFAATESELHPDLINRWNEGFERLQQREPFPHDRQAFPFHPLELLGLALAAARFADSKGKKWLREVIERTPTFMVSLDFWSGSLMELAACILNAKKPRGLLPSLWLPNDENCALLFWVQTLVLPPPSVPMDIPAISARKPKSISKRLSFRRYLAYRRQAM